MSLEGVVISKECSLVMAASQGIKNQQPSYKVCEKKPDMECTTFSGPLLGE